MDQTSDKKKVKDSKAETEDKVLITDEIYGDGEPFIGELS